MCSRLFFSFIFVVACFFSHYLVYNPTTTNTTHNNNQNINSKLTHQPNLILISVNGLIWYQGNPLADTQDPDPLGQFDWLRQTFQWARKRKDKVLLVSHFPPGASENAPQYYRFLRTQMNDQFVNLLIENADLLMAGLFAHEHVDSFRLLVSKSNVPLASLFLMPSISPLMIYGLGDFNPRIRLYRFQRSTMSLLGYSQYYFNLENQLSQSPDHQHHRNWQLEYDTKETYHLMNLSANSLNELWNHFLDINNNTDSYWSNYWNYELGNRSHSLKPNYLTDQGLCPKVRSQCRCDHLCAMRFLIFTDLDKCLELCKQLVVVTNGRGGDGGSDGLQHPMFMTGDANNHSTNKQPNTDFNHSSIDNETITVNPNERSSLPYIIGVIVAFLVVLVGVVLIVNREVCNRHRGAGGYHQRRSLLASMIGYNGTNSTTTNTTPAGAGGGGIAGNGLFLNPINGGTLHGSRSITGATNNYCTSGGGGSCIELRTAFHPSYYEDEIEPEYLNKSVTSLNAINFSHNNNNNNNHTTANTVHDHTNQQGGNYISPFGHYNNAVLSPSRTTSYYENHSDNSRSSSASSSYCNSRRNNNNNSVNNQRIIQNYIDKRYSASDYAYLKKYLSNHINPTDKMLYMVNQLFDCHEQSNRTNHRHHHHDTTTNISNKLLLSTDEKKGSSHTTSERSSKDEYHDAHPRQQHHQHQHLYQNNNCLPEDYYADDEAFGDEDCHDRLPHYNHQHYHVPKHQNTNENMIADDDDDDVDGQDKCELSTSSRAGGYHHQLTVDTDKKFQLDQIKNQFNCHRSHRHQQQQQSKKNIDDHHDDGDVDEDDDEDDDDSINDQLYHSNQESQLLDPSSSTLNDVVSGRKHSKDRKFIFNRKKFHNPLKNAKHFMNPSSIASSSSSSSSSTSSAASSYPSSSVKLSNHMKHSQSMNFNNINKNSKENDVVVSSSSSITTNQKTNHPPPTYIMKHNPNPLLTSSSLTCLSNQTNHKQLNSRQHYQQSPPQQHQHQQSQSNYTSPSRQRFYFPLSISSSLIADKNKSNQLPPTTTSSSSVLLTGNQSAALQHYDHVTDNTMTTDFRPIDHHNHTNNSNNHNHSRISFPNIPTNLSVLKIPGYDYVRMSN
ncbi:unnamed protein product [Schistosoma turkestanicum]|nr:unnamed protein product [Schistosoma turkestanicum]